MVETDFRTRPDQKEVESDPDVTITNGILLRQELLKALGIPEQPQVKAHDEFLAPSRFSVLREQIKLMPNMSNIFDGAIQRGKFDPDKDVTEDSITNVIQDAESNGTTKPDIKALRMIRERYATLAAA